MVNHGVSGRIEKLRLDMIHAGPSFWQVCSPEEVEYRVDEQCLEFDGLCEIFSRVTVWKIPDDDQQVPPQDKLGLILKLERSNGSDPPTNLTQTLPDMPSKDRLSWKYFDLQDIVTPGLDTRPWFHSAKLAAVASRSTNPLDSQSPLETDKSPENDFWRGYESSSDAPSSPSSSGSKASVHKRMTGSSVPIDPVLAARIRDTPVYRSKAPSVSSTNSDDHQQHPIEGTPSLGKQLGPADLLSKISRTPLYKRAPSIQDSPTNPAESKHATIDLDQILQAAGIVNRSEELQDAVSRAIRFDSKDSQRTSSEREARQNDSSACGPIPRVKSGIEPNLSINPSRSCSQVLQHYSDAPSRSQSSIPPLEQVEEKLMNSLRATYQLYSLTLHQHSLDQHLLNPGELFIALAHRVVLEESSRT